MKDLIKLLSVITGFFRSIVTILFLLGIFFLVLVDVNLLLAFLDIIGFAGLSTGVVKPLLIGLSLVLFVINFIISRHVFKAGDTGKYHPSNLFFALVFLSLTALAFISFRNLGPVIFYVFFAFNGLLALNSILGLIAKARGLYKSEEASNIKNTPSIESDFIEFEDKDSKKEIIIEEPVLITSDETTGEIDTELSKNEASNKTSSSTIENNKANKETKVIDSKDVRKDVRKEASKRIEVKANEKLVFGASDKNNIDNTNKIAKKKPRLSKNTREDKKEVLVDKNSTNRLEYDSSDIDDKKTYGDDDSKAINKAREEKIYDRSTFTNRVDINKDDSNK